jgi:predicted transcriptional regulator
MKTTSLRLDDEQARALDALALTEGTSVSEVIREAINDRIAKRRADKAFQAKLRQTMEESREALELLAK